MERGRELNYVHAANLADGTAQLFMSKRNVNNHHSHNQEPTRPSMKSQAEYKLHSTKEQQQMPFKQACRSCPRRIGAGHQCMRILLKSKDICQAQNNERVPLGHTKACHSPPPASAWSYQAILEWQPAPSLPDIQDMSYETGVALWLPLPDSCCHMPDLGSPALL